MWDNVLLKLFKLYGVQGLLSCGSVLPPRGLGGKRCRAFVQLLRDVFFSTLSATLQMFSIR